MKKFQALIGQVACKLLTVGLVIFISFILMFGYYESQKDDMFYEAIEYFHNQYEFERDNIYMDNGLLTHEYIRKVKPKLTKI